MASETVDGFYVGQHLRIGELDSTGNFVVQAVMHGGMGVCLKVSNGNKTFALKGMLGAFLPNVDARERFRKELDIWYTCAACDGVVGTNGIVMINALPFMSAEWVDGGDLSGRLQSMTAQDKIKMFLGIVDAFRVVHEKYGTIHRDLKPQNILVREPDRPLISDWGLAKIYADPIRTAIGNERLSGDSSVVSGVVGTVLYMSPEQLTPNTQIDFRSDIYALGCILYEFETGKPPFVARTCLEIARMHMREQPPKLGGLFRRTAMGMERIILRCLQKNPNDRYNSYVELLADVRKVAESRGVTSYYKAQILTERVLPGDGSAYAKATKLNDGKEVLSNKSYLALRQECDMLVQTGRFKVAIKLLRPLINIENIMVDGVNWGNGASLLESYAHALMQDQQYDEAERCYTSLSRFLNKPSTYYVNASYLMIHRKHISKGLEIGLEGVSVYRNDKDIVGNLSTLYFMHGDADKSIEYAMRAWKIGSPDINDCECLNSALSLKTEKLRYHDLDAFAENMTLRYSAIRHGLSLNPSYPTMQTMRAQFIQEVDEDDGASYCASLLKSPHLQGTAREAILSCWADAQYERAWFATDSKIIAGIIDELGAHMNDDVDLIVKAKIRDAYYSLCFKYLSRIKGDPLGAGRQVSEWLMMKHDGAYRRPCDAAQVLYKIGQRDKALDVIVSANHVLDWRTIQIHTSLLLQMDRAKDALDVAHTATRHMPAHREVWMALHCAYKALGKSVEAKSAYKKCQKLWIKEQSILGKLKAMYMSKN